MIGMHYYHSIKISVERILSVIDCNSIQITKNETYIYTTIILNNIGQKRDNAFFVLLMMQVLIHILI
jgi:hypothetical protein